MNKIYLGPWQRSENGHYFRSLLTEKYLTNEGEIILLRQPEVYFDHFIYLYYYF